MKVKFVLELVDNNDFQKTKSLQMKILLPTEALFSEKIYQKIIIKGDIMEYIANPNYFYDDVYDFINDTEEIINEGKKFMNEIIKTQLRENRKNETENILKNMRPIEVDIRYNNKGIIDCEI